MSEPFVALVEEELEPVGRHEAETHLPRLVEQTTPTGCPIIITNRGHGTAPLIPARPQPEPVCSTDEE